MGCCRSRRSRQDDDKRSLAKCKADARARDASDESRAEAGAVPHGIGIAINGKHLPSTEHKGKARPPVTIAINGEKMSSEDGQNCKTTFGAEDGVLDDDFAIPEESTRDGLPLAANYRKTRVEALPVVETLPISKEKKKAAKLRPSPRSAPRTGPRISDAPMQQCPSLAPSNPSRPSGLSALYGNAISEFSYAATLSGRSSLQSKMSQSLPKHLREAPCIDLRDAADEAEDSCHVVSQALSIDLTGHHAESSSRMGPLHSGGSCMEKSIYVAPSLAPSHAQSMRSVRTAKSARYSRAPTRERSQYCKERFALYDSMTKVVMDIGACSARIGIAGETKPSSVTSSVHKTKRGSMMAAESCMESIWERSFAELGVEPAITPLLLTESPMVSQAIREMNVQILFETFRVPAVHIANPAVLSLLSTGRSTGIALDFGDSATHMVPVYEGVRITASTHCLSIGGRELSEYMAELLNKKHALHRFSFTQLHTIGQAVKEISAQVGKKNEKSGKGVPPESYYLPDGQVIQLELERFQCPESLFKPSLLHKGREKGVSDLAAECILSCHPDLRRTMASNLVLAGGTSLINGLEERLCTGLSKLMPKALSVVVDATPDRLHAAWLGGSIVASTSKFPGMCFTKEDYEERGPSAVHFCCL